MKQRAQMTRHADDAVGTTGALLTGEAEGQQAQVGAKSSNDSGTNAVQ